MKFIHGAAALLVFCLSAQAGADAGLRLLKVADRQTVDIAKFGDEAAGSDVVFIGEVHDRAEQHRQWMEVIRGMHGRKLPLAIGIEMFTADGQKQLDDWVQGKVEEEAFRKIYDSHWSYDWSLYRDLFLFARDNRIPMIALNVPKKIMSKVVRGGSASLTDAEKKALPPAGGWTLNPTQRAYMKKIREQLFGNRPSPLPARNFEEAQALRNDSFAWNVARFLEKSPKTKVVVIAGTWHAIRSGAPEDLKKYGSPASTVVLPQLPEIDLTKLGVEEADFMMLK